jgi:hypothetical protein
MYCIVVLGAVRTAVIDPPAQVVAGEHADHAVLLVDHGQAPDTSRSHDHLGLVQGFLRPRCGDVPCHDVGNLQLVEAAATGVGRHADVSVGKDAVQVTGVVDHRSATAVVLPEQASRRGKGVSGAATPHVLGHPFVNSHV